MAVESNGSSVCFGSKLPDIKFTKLFINGEFVDALSGKTFETIDPRTGEVIARIAEGDAEDVDLAVKAARDAFDHGPWPRLPGSERRRIMLKFADLVEQNIEELAAMDAIDAGKLFSTGKAIDIPFAINTLQYYAGAADKIHGKTLKMSRELQGYTLREPIGVVGHIIPWNYPSNMFFMKASPSLAAGCTMVIKPAEQTPLSALYYAHLSKLAGVPDGVINVVTGFGPTAGAAVSSHMDIDKVSFTGSTEVGRLVMQAAATSNLKPVSLELGGKSPLLIFDDADVDTAADLALLGVFCNKGELCVSSSRVLVQEGIYDELVEKLAKKAKAWVVGDPFDPSSCQGPQVDKNQYDKILSYIEHGKREGATLLAGGKPCGEKGYYIEPTIFTDVMDSMLIAQDEIFGPVMSLMKFKTVDEGIKRANATRYGLAAGIVTKDLNVANTVSSICIFSQEELQAKREREMAVQSNGSSEPSMKVPSIKFTKLFIDGEFVDSISGRTFETINPSTGEAIARVAEGDKEDIDLAERRRIMMKFADLIDEHVEELAALDTIDAGKLFSMNKALDVPIGANFLRYYAGAADKIHGETLKMSRELQGYTLREPIGVVGHIIPWNFPSNMFFIKVSPALAAGCTMVVKPAEQTPLSALYYAHLAKLAGLPNGVINVVTGYGHTAGAAISSHMDIDKGEICMASSRILVQEGIYDELVKTLAEKANTWVVGDPFDPSSHQGPQANKKQYEKVLSYIEHGKREGAMLLTGGKACGKKGYYIEPTIFTDVMDNMLIAKDEIFGPVMSLMKFKTVDEAIKRANATRYGLAAGIVTNDLNVANTVSRSIRAGMIWINCYLALDIDCPVGGYKMSGFGRDHGMEALDQYLQVKAVVTPIYNSPWL
ncbi:hypothetical protein RJ639_001468 [Escallonia herrerae]|uniref:Aldehyde dehydrogenase 1 n=1 Tax=Escallonia herrerae TaxID=1293975 RepID=A0AA88X847_9ASTE|nr:hypothetical protein RJ639_001468 [Escallonia herrerae]